MTYVSISPSRIEQRRRLTATLPANFKAWRKALTATHIDPTRGPATTFECANAIAAERKARGKVKSAWWLNVDWLDEGFAHSITEYLALLRLWVRALYSAYEDEHPYVESSYRDLPLRELLEARGAVLEWFEDEEGNLHSQVVETEENEEKLMNELHIYKVGMGSNTRLVEAPSPAAAAVYYGMELVNTNNPFMTAVYEEDGVAWEGDSWWLNPFPSVEFLDTTMAMLISELKQCSQIVEPTIVCLCGSTRFLEAFREANLRETLDGKIVLTIGCDTHSDDSLFIQMSSDEKAVVKERLDRLHLHKIRHAHEVLILNVGGYIGESTRREMEYARRLGKRIRFLEKVTGDDAARL